MYAAPTDEWLFCRGGIYPARLFHVKSTLIEKDPHRRAGATGAAHGNCTDAFAHRRCGDLRCIPKHKKPRPAPKARNGVKGVLRTANIPMHLLTAGAPC